MEYKIYTDVDSIPWDGYGRIGKDLDAAGESGVCARVAKEGASRGESKRSGVGRFAWELHCFWCLGHYSIQEAPQMSCLKWDKAGCGSF